ncbi:hypothetical protein BGZ82_004418 [Podila clonocystis]|nr:hypothetical protein BGZ82_004418 [Podila clonocystis]
MSHDRGIITVVDQNEEQDDEDLVALRQLPRFEPLVVPEVPSQFSLASVFGSLSVAKHSDVGEQAFNPNTLVDIFVQVNAHNKRCAQDIQDYQRLLAIKMKTLDDYTASAVQELGSIHQRAKANSDQLLSACGHIRAPSTGTRQQGNISGIIPESTAIPPASTPTVFTRYSGVRTKESKWIGRT